MLAVAFLMAAGEASGRTPVGPPPPDALAAPSRADVSLMVAESTVFWRRKKLEGGGAPPVLWLADVVVPAVRLPTAEPAADAAPAALLPPPPAAPDADAVMAASRVSPPDEARRPVFDDVAEMERWTLRGAADDDALALAPVPPTAAAPPPLVPVAAPAADEDDV